MGIFTCILSGASVSSLNYVAITMGQLIFHQLILLSIFLCTKFCLCLILLMLIWYQWHVWIILLVAILLSFLWMKLFLIMLNLERNPDESIGSRAHPGKMLGGWLTLYWFDVNFPSVDVWHVTPSDMEEVMRFSMLPRIQCSGDEKCKGLDNCYWIDDLKDGLHAGMAYAWSKSWAVTSFNMKMAFPGIVGLNSSPPSAAYMRQWTGPPLVQIMAWCLTGDKPLSEPMLTYCQFDPWEQTSAKFESKYKRFHWWKCIWKCLMWNGDDFVQGGNGLKW